MKSLLTTTLLALVLFSAQALSSVASSEGREDGEGGIHIGNGGKVLHCPSNNNQTSFTVLDLYELGKKLPTFGNNQSAPSQMAYNAILPLRELDPSRYKRLKHHIENFIPESRFIHNQKLGGISDIGLTHIPRHCNLVQAVVQMPKVSSDGSFRTHYNIDYNVWDKLDNVNKAGLILHEVVYRDFSQGSAHNTSYYVRGFVRMLATSAFKNYTLKQYIELLQSLYVKNYDYNRVKIDLRGNHPVTFSDDHQKISTAPLVTPQKFKILANELTTHSKVKHEFYPNGQIKYLSIVRELGESEQARLWMFSTYVPISFTAAIQHVSYDEDGNVLTMRLVPNIYSRPRIWVNDTYMSLLPNSLIGFDPVKQIPNFAMIKTKKGFQVQSQTFIRLKKTRYLKCVSTPTEKCFPID